ncbi:MAG: hypothetical protein AB8H79_10685 [Myxococcota bacterium]
MNPRIHLIATSLPDDDKMLVEIYIDGEALAELVEDTPSHQLVIYGKVRDKPWSFPSMLFTEALEAATIRLDRLIPRRA